MSYSLLCYAQDTTIITHPRETSVRLLFPKGESHIEASYQENGKRMAQFERSMEEMTKDRNRRLLGIMITTGTSPDGSSIVNGTLSDRRCAAVKDYVNTVLSNPEIKISVASNGIDWRELKQMILSSDMSERVTATEIIDNTPVWVVRDGTVVDSRKRRLMLLDGGKSWHYMEEHFFPKLRGASVTVAWEEMDSVNIPVTSAIPKDTITDTVTLPTTVSPDTVPSDTLQVPWSIPQRINDPEILRYSSIGIGTNLLLDIMFIANLNLEFQFAHNWSSGLNWMYGWKEHDATRLLHAYGGEIHMRYWTGTGLRPLSGHRLGAYCQMLRYNLKRSERGYLSDRWTIGAGIEYGYSIPFGDHFRLDIGLGVGYLTGVYQEYVRQDDCDVWEATERLHWIGPTKAEISLIWVPARKTKKGGTR